MNEGIKIRVAAVFTCCLLLSAPADTKAEEGEQIPAALEGELKYLLGFVGRSRAEPAGFSGERIQGLIGFVDAAKDSRRLYHAENPKGLASAYYETDIRRDLDHIMRLTYSAELPEVLTAPSTLRRTEWTHLDNGYRRLPRLWEMEGKAPVFFTGTEHLVNTPDQTTGAYYDYGLYRTVMLTTVKGRRLLLSLSKQTGVSGVGRKGLIVGPDERWDYLYTGEAGLNRFGIGWANTYLYDSYSVALYLESTGKSQVRFGVFKWLGAGWNGINMVKDAHIHAGLERYGTTFRQIAEHPTFTDLFALEKAMAAVHELSDERMRQLAGQYLSQVSRQAQRQGLVSAGEAREWLDKGKYLKAVERADMESILIVEYLKKLLGKPYQVDVPKVPAKE